MIDDLKSCQIFLISVSSKCWHLFVPFSHLSWCISVSCYVKRFFLLNYGYLRNYVWDSGSHLNLILVDLLWLCSFKGWGNVRTECKFIFPTQSPFTLGKGEISFYNWVVMKSWLSTKSTLIPPQSRIRRVTALPLAGNGFPLVLQAWRSYLTT